MSDLEKRLNMAIERIEDMLEGDDPQAWKEAEKWLPYIKGEVGDNGMPKPHVGVEVRLYNHTQLIHFKGVVDTYVNVDYRSVEVVYVPRLALNLDDESWYFEFVHRDGCDGQEIPIPYM